MRIGQWLTGMILALALPVTGFAQSRAADEQQIGDAQHAQMEAQFGGLYQDRRVTDYVNRIGAKLVAQSTQPNDKWTFGVLNSPVVNAFAIPGGYVYVTRGLLALANDEAELAGVLGHEIGHVTAGHGADRRDRNNNAGLGVIAGVIIGGLLNGSDGARDAARIGTKIAGGYLAGHSREQEFEADKLGIRLLVKAGYDPYAQADFLDNLAGQYQLDAQLAGKDHNPNRVDFFDSHPATAARMREAIAEAKRSGVTVDNAAPRREADYLDAIDGMVFGDAPSEGFVRGRKFLHPELRFAFEVPEGFRIQNTAARILANGPDEARMILESRDDPGGRLDRFISQTWVPGIARNNRIRGLRDVKRLEINGLEAATGTITAEARDGVRIVQLTAIRSGGQVYMLQGVTRENARGTRDALDDAARTFKRLSQAEASDLRPYRLHVYRVRRGDTIGLLAASIPLSTLREERFRLLNNYDDGQEMRTGDLVKLILQ